MITAWSISLSDHDWPSQVHGFSRLIVSIRLTPLAGEEDRLVPALLVIGNTKERAREAIGSRTVDIVCRTISQIFDTAARQAVPEMAFSRMVRAAFFVS